MVPGFVRVSVKGQQCQRFVNLCRGREMDLKRIIRTGETELQLTMKVADFLQLSPLRRKTGVHIHILKKRGPLFFLLFCKRRKMIPAGFLAVCCLLFFLSGRVWNVEIRGNILNPTPQLMSFLKEQGVCFGVSRKKISCSALAASLRREFPEITWVSAGFSGTGLRFEIREGTAGEKAEPEEKSCSLFSTLDGVIDSMVTRQGTPLVRAGDEIKKGQELVSGIVDITDDSQEVIRYAYVQADADIYIRHTIAYYDTFPLDMEKKVWSDKKKTRLFFQLGNWFLDFSSPLKENEERLVSREPLFSIGIFRSPVTLWIAAIGKYEVQKEQLTEDVARTASAEALLPSLNGPEEKPPQKKRRSQKKGHQRMASSIIELYVDVPADRQANIFGQFDEHLKLIERTLNVTMIFRDGSLKILGSQEGATQARAIVEELNTLAGRGNTITQQNVNYALSLAMEKIGSVMEEIDKDFICNTIQGRPIKPKTLGQKDYVEQIRKKMIVFGVGPAGTGKTYLAMAMAVTAFRNEEVSRIILTRPAIEAGEKLGFLPGDLQSKVDPYLRPLYDALYQIMGADSFAKNMEKGLIEVAPLAYMRGRTLDNAFIILDEAQNTTPAQMKMFLTRIGFGSKVIITGDASQKDLPRDATSGLDVAMKVLKKIDDIGFCQLTSKDVVRHPLVQQIVQAYDDYEKKQKPAKSRKDDRYAVKNKEYRR